MAISACLPGNADFKSTTMRLAIDRADPTGEFTAPPIVAWSSALWDSTTEVRILTAAWRMQMIRMRQGSWRKILGPAAACIMSLRRIGWSWPSPTTLLTHQGEVVDMETTCPMDIKAMVQLAANNAM